MDKDRYLVIGVDFSDERDKRRREFIASNERREVKERVLDFCKRYNVEKFRVIVTHMDWSVTERMLCAGAAAIYVSAACRCPNDNDVLWCEIEPAA